MRHSITNELKTKIMHLHKQGKNGVEIGEEIGFSSSAVLREIRIITGVYKKPETNRVNIDPKPFEMNSHDPLEYSIHGAPFCY